MEQPKSSGFAQTMSLLLFVIKENHPNSKCSYYRFPKLSLKFSFDPKKEFCIKEKIGKMSNKWRKLQ
jgi:hypothetical protein